MSDKPAPIFGIDLGTTYSCIAYVDEFNKPVVVPNSAGDRTTPSVVQFADTERIVGKEAKNNSASYPDSTVQVIKRSMGKPGFTFIYQDSNYTPEEISSYILRKVVSDAEQYTGMKITDVVITCPAYFGIPERDATAKAGEIAGLNVRSIINEPTAAAISYGVNNQSDQVVLVYDLGGGTFDVTMIEIKGGDITVICTDGDHLLGGRNWDESLIAYMAEEWQKQTGSGDDPMEDFETLEDMYQKAEQAKQALTQRDKTDIPVIHSGHRAKVSLTLEKFDELTAPLLERTIELTKLALAEAAKRGYRQFDQLLLVGGSTRMRQVAKRLQQEFGQEPRIFEPDEAVAKGAAVYGQKLALDQEIKIKIADAMGVSEEAVVVENVDARVLENAQREVAAEMGLQLGAVKAMNSRQIRNVSSRSFGITAWDRTQQKEIVSNLIIKNDPVPADVTQQFSTMEANQPTALLKVVDNVSSDKTYSVDDSREIGQAELDLPPGLPEGSPISITFKLNEQGRLDVTGKELSQGHIVEASFQTEGSISEADMAAATARSKALVIS